MSNHPGAKKDQKKSEPSKGNLEESQKVEGHPDLGDIKHKPGALEFLIEFIYAGDEWRGNIKHRMTNKQDQFLGLDLEKITQFMKPYLSRMEKSVIKKPMEQPSQPVQALAEEQEKKGKEISLNEVRTTSYGVIAAGTTHTTGLLQQGQPFKIQWSFEPPSIPGMESEKMDYKIIVYRKELPGGAKCEVDRKEGQKGLREPLTASFECESLPPGTYRLQGHSLFSIKSKKPEWRSLCRETCLVDVI